MTAESMPRPGGEGLAAAKNEAPLGLIYRRLIPRLGENTARDTVCELAASIQQAMYMPGGRRTRWERLREKHEREMSA
ncbi:MAG: hypothetical protein JRJ80_15610 [Deltaproteobacteria bacterium]|nr:hypothetical protein [Deltaproteobacteria bacterium]MBW1906035.1 hypothetical protein [Deltaproteobacteria bacterium]